MANVSVLCRNRQKRSTAFTGLDDFDLTVVEQSGIRGLHCKTLFRSFPSLPEHPLFEKLRVQSAKDQAESRLRIDRAQRIDAAEQCWHATHETDQPQRQGDRLLADLVNGLSARLTAISSSLGACELSLASEAADTVTMDRVQFALNVANEEIRQAKQLARSVRGLARSYARQGRSQMTLNAIFDQVLQIAAPRLEAAATQVQTDFQPIGAVVNDATQCILAFVSLIESIVEEFEDAGHLNRKIKIESAVNAGKLEILISGLATIAANQSLIAGGCEQATNGEQVDQSPHCFDTRRSEIATWLSRELHGHAFVTRTARNEPAYRIRISMHAMHKQGDFRSNDLAYELTQANGLCHSSESNRTA